LKNTAVLKGHTNSVHSVAFSPDGKTLASGSLDETIKLWDVADGKEKATLQGHSQCVNSVAFSPDGKILASGSHVFNKKAQVVSGEVKLWDVATGKNTANITAHTYLVFCVTFSPDGKTLVSASDETIRLWDVIVRAMTTAIRLIRPIFVFLIK
jgi:WD40 repeat protein